MSMFAETIAFELQTNATSGDLEIKKQTKGFGQGLVNEATGLLNGGATGAFGMAHTVADVAKIAVGAKFKDTLTQIPVIGGVLV